MLDVLAWYITITLVGLIALPVAYRLLPNLADRGYILARALGMLLWGFVFWLLTSLGILQNNTGGVIMALGLVALVSLAIGGGLKGWGDAFRFLRSRLRLVLVTEILFLAAFLFLAVTRAASPDISGTEKPMELAFINSILHSPSFPPSDPWLSGYAISYYYFGYVMVAMLIRVTGVTVGVGFNLAISLWFAMTALGAFGVAYSLLSAWCRRRQAQGKPGLLAAGWALLAPFYVLIVSNLGGFLEVLHDRGIFWTQTANGMQSSFWTWLGIIEWSDPPSLPLSWIPNRAGGIWWWRSSRIVQDYTFSGVYKEVIDEFPFFSYYLADLHPHVLAMPFVLLAVALALNLYFSGSSLRFSELRLRTWVKRIDFWLYAVVLGGLAFLNTWDFPIYLAFFSAAFTLVRFQQEGWKWKARLWDFVVQVVGFGIAGILLYLPFFFGFESQAGGILPSLAFFTRGVHFWIMFAPFLAPIFAWLIWLWRRRHGTSSLSAGLRFAGVAILGLGTVSWLLGLLGVSLPAIGASMSVSQSPLIANLGSTLTNLGNLFISNQGAADAGTILVNSIARRIVSPGTWITLCILITLVWGILYTYHCKVFAIKSVLQEGEVPPTAISLIETPVAISEPEKSTSVAIEQEDKPQPDFSSSGSPSAFLLLMVLVGAGLTLAPEFVYLRDQFGDRMNTIFKFYFQTWILWGVAAAVVSVILWHEIRRWRKAVFSIFWIILLAMSLAYPVFALSDRVDFSVASTWSLDGEASFAAYNPDDWAVIRWLQDAPYGVVAEAIGGDYSGYARIATHSGLPAVLGWPPHEIQWRGSGKEMGTRETDISLLYTTSDWSQALQICRQYNIRYVVIGGLERSTYKVDVQKFKSHLTPVFTSNNTVIYEIPPLSVNENG
jgi:YYY domain-containing protein